MAQKEKQQYMIFASNLRQHYEKWKVKEYGRNQGKLAKAVGLKDRKSIFNYMNAVNYPDPDILEKLCEVLETTPEELNGLNDDFMKKYKYDEETAQKVRNGYDAFCTGIGLNNDFLKYVRSALPDSVFPLFTPLYQDFFTDQYVRTEPIETVENHDRPEQQITTSDGIHSDLTYPDYAFLKDVQDKVTELIEIMYYKRSKEMETAVKRINSECMKTTPDGKQYFVKADKKMLCEYDPYYRYILGENGEIINSQLEKEGKLNNGKH